MEIAGFLGRHSIPEVGVHQESSGLCMDRILVEVAAIRVVVDLVGTSTEVAAIRVVVVQEVTEAIQSVGLSAVFASAATS